MVGVLVKTHKMAGRWGLWKPPAFPFLVYGLEGSGKGNEIIEGKELMGIAKATRVAPFRRSQDGWRFGQPGGKETRS